MKFNSLLLSAAVLVCGIPLSACGAQTGEAENGASYTTLDAAELNTLVQSDGAVLVDVRTPQEFADGHLEGAINMPLGQFDPKALPKEDGKETILYCASGNRSGQAAKAYVEATGQSIRHLNGGIGAWKGAGLPVQK